MFRELWVEPPARASAQVGDMIRSTIVCVDGDGILEAWHRCSADSGFRITPDHGRLKNSFGTKKHQPPDMLLNVHVDETPDRLPIVAEVQIHLLGIYQLKELNHRYCEPPSHRASLSRATRALS